MITEDYVSFETAKLLKDKGFNEVCNSYYVTGGINNKGEITISFHNYGETTAINFNDYANELYSYLEYYSAPTLQMAMKWLREKHNLYIQPEVTSWPQPGFYARIYLYVERSNIFKDMSPVLYEFSYEESVEKAIKYCLENLI